MVNVMRRCLFVSALVVIGTLTDRERANAAEKNVDQQPVPTLIESGRILVAVSESGKTVYGFSDITGRWSKTSVELGTGNVIQPIVASDVACFVMGTKAYAFGAQSGVWSVIDIGVGATPPRVGTRVRIDSGSKLFIFTSASAEWSVVDLAKD
jgi:hypothetical protein